MTSVSEQTLSLHQSTLKAETKEANPPFTIFSRWEKTLYVYTASLAGFASPVSSSIYYPALNLLARDLHTSLSNINLTITTYLVCQALAPTLIGGFSDRYGRRPAYLICFILYMGANTGLALQTKFVALLLLRMLQSSGSSGTVALSNGVVSDIATRAERGSYISLASLGQSLGPAFGPVIGGLLTHFLGWRAIFWFLDIYAGCILIFIAIFIPETCRNIVGNGSVPPQKWNVSLMTYLHRRRQRKRGILVSHSTLQKKCRPSLLSSLPILINKEMFLLLIFGGVLYAGFYIILAGLSPQLASTYDYNPIQVGLCYIPTGVGALLSKSVVGRLIDWNFRRHACAQNITIVKTKQTDITNFPIERARLEIGVALVYLSCITIIPYGWVMNMHHPPLAAALLLLFFNGFATSGSFQTLSVLVVDCNPDGAAAATAANNLVRCLLAAGGIAALQPMLNKIGRGWTSTLIAAVWVLMSSFWWSVMRWGPQWRAAKREKDNTKKNNNREKGEKGRDIEQANDGGMDDEEDVEQSIIVEDRREDGGHGGSAFSTTARGG